MKVELQVIASSAIKRKKPWPRLAFLGQVQESIFLLDHHRASILYVPSGKTKRKISSLDPLLHSTTALNHSYDGNFLVGLLTSGDAYLWHKDTNLLKFFQGNPALAYKGESNVPDCQKPHIWIADTGRHCLAISPGYSEALIWEASPSQHVLAPNSNQIQGSWSTIEVPSPIHLPDKASFESTCSACFCVRESIGECCLYGVVFCFGNQICVTTLQVQWLDTQHIYSYRQPTYQAEWKSKLHPLTSIHPNAVPVDSPGAFVSKFSNDGQLYAVAVNQNHLTCCKMLYVAPSHEIVVCADLKSMGLRGSVDAGDVRSHWITDITWTHDDLYVICINGQGLVGMLTRLGEPVLLATRGLSIEMGPRFYLPLHPLINYSSSNNDSPLRQKYSVCAHPRNPIVMTSDGFVVTVMRYAIETTCLSLMNSLSAAAVRYMRRIREMQSSSNMFDSVKKQSQHAIRQKQGAKSHGIHADREKATPSDYQFEAPGDDALDDTLDRPLLSQFSAQNGQLTFGDNDNLNSTLDHASVTSEEGLSSAELLNRSQRALFGAWALAVSHTGVWTTHHEEALSNITHNLNRLMNILLSMKASTLKELDAIQNQGSETKKKNKSRGLHRVLQLFMAILNILPLDSLHKNAQVCVLDLIHSVIALLATSSSLHDLQPHTQTLQGCYALLRHCEVVLAVYDPCPGALQSNTDPYTAEDLPLTNADLFSPSIAESPRNHHQSQTMLKQPYPQNQNSSPRSDINTSAQSQSVQRLTRSWVFLYRQCMQHYRSLISTCLQQDSVPLTDEATNLQKTVLLDSKRIHQLIYTLQCRLHSLNQDLPQRRKKHHLHKGDKLSIEGTSTPAIFSYLQFVESSSDRDAISHTAGKLLHGTLYSHLINDDLSSAIELVELLARNGDLRKGAGLAKQDFKSRKNALLSLQQVSSEPQSPICVLENPMIRHLTVTLARIMAAYYSNHELFVYPPHQPYRVPPLHVEYSSEHRTVPLYRDQLTAAIRLSQLSSIWTPERALCYLLLSGCVVEAVWLLHELGDWKAAFIVGTASEYHQEHIAAELYKRKKKLELPKNLRPVSILKQQLAQIVRDPQSSETFPLLLTDESDLENLHSTLSDLLLATCFCGMDIVPWILETFLQRLKAVVSQMKPLVPSGLYLPAPPIYCPQPASDMKGREDEVKEELVMRKEASSLVILFCIVLSASNTATPVLSWYAQHVLDVLSNTTKKKKNSQLVLDIEFLQETYLQGSSAFHGKENMASVKRLLGAMRDLCSVCWMLHVRDELSLSLRKKSLLAHTQGNNNSGWHQHCRRSMKLCRQLMPFRFFLSNGEELCHSLLSLIMELPQTTEMAKVLAEHFYDIDSHDPEVQEKVKGILNDWKGVMVGEQADDVFIDSPRSLPGESPRGVPLSVYYQGKANTIGKLFKQRLRTFGHYEEFVFRNNTEQNGVLHIGSRGFESTQEYMQFLDMFFAVSFNRLAENEADKNVTWPLIEEYGIKVRNRELRAVSRKDSFKNHSSAQRGQSVIVIQSPREPAPSSPRKFISVKTSTPLPKGPSRKGGLFRSRSLTEMKSNKSRKQRSASDDDISQRLSRQSSEDEGGLDALSSPFVTQWMLDSFIFDKSYHIMATRLDWLNGWSSRNHTLFPGAKDDKNKGALRCAMKLRMSSKLLVYSHWLLDNCHYKAPIIPPTEITVAAVHRQDYNSPSRTVTPLRMASPPSVLTSPAQSPSIVSGIEPLSPTPKKLSKKERKKIEKERKKEKKQAKKREQNREVEEMMMSQETVEVEVRSSNNSLKKLSFKLDDEIIEDIPHSHLANTEESIDISSLKEDEYNNLMRTTTEPLRLTDLRVSATPTPPPVQQPYQPPQASPVVIETSPPSTLVDQGMNTMHYDEPRTTDENVAGEVQNIVRQEMRRLMEAQHRGILAMLGALNDNELENQHQIPAHSAPQTPEPAASTSSSLPRLALSELQNDHSRRLLNVEEALHDLHLLRNEEKQKQQKNKRTGKENFDLPPPSHYEFEPDYSQDQPYSGLMEALREMNSNLSHERNFDNNDPPMLLRMPSNPSANNSVRFPVIPTHNTTHNRQRWTTDSTRMPLLRMNSSNADPQYFVQQIPERDTNQGTSLNFNTPFPLLQFPGEDDPYHDRTPLMASADEIMAYHKRRIEEARQNQQPPAGDQENAAKERQSRERRRKTKKQNDVKKIKLKQRKTGEESEEGVESLPLDSQNDTMSAVHEEMATTSQPKTATPQIHSGYAITPGLCDDYLDKEDEVHLPLHTPSSVHYSAAVKMQESLRKPSNLKKDMWTETDPIMEERGTAMSEGRPTPRNLGLGSNFAEPGSILPPDIFMGLKFNEQGPVPTSKQLANSYINIVDIHADTIDDMRPPNRSSRHSPRKVSPRQVKFQSKTPTPRASQEDLIPGPDPTTQKLLSSKSDLSEDAIKTKRSKADIKKRLRDMNEQFNAIETLQKNIEMDFKASKLLAHTIEHFGEAMMPERDEPTATVLDSFEASKDPSSNGPQQSPRETVEPPLISQSSPRHHQKQEPVDVRLSGLSGVSDIVGEILARGSFDPEDVGLTPKQAKKLVDKALDSKRGVRMSNEELIEFLEEAATSPRPALTDILKKKQKRSEEEKKELREWMSNKRRERSKEHKQRQTELREHEKKPFRSSLGASHQEMKVADEERETKKKLRYQENEEKRKQEASRLMGEILKERPPEMLYPDVHVNTKERSPKIKAKKTSKPTTSARSRSLPRKVSAMDYRQPSPRREEYTSFRTERRPSLPDAAQPSARSEPQLTTTTTKKPYWRSQKPLHEMVRLQHPEKTRPKKNRPAPKTYTERLLESSRSLENTPRSPMSQKIASRIPVAKSDRPRVVKSYTERLQDMKKTRTINTSPVKVSKFSEQKDNRVMRGGRLTEVKRAAISPSKPRKTLSYSEQLQQLQPPKDMYRSGTSTFTVKPARKWQRAPHKPKTYVQQLRELQQPSSSQDIWPPHQYPTQRSRPYADPYTEIDDASVVSPWSVEDNVQQILQDADGTIMMTHTDASDLDIAELRQLADLPLDDSVMEYTDMVDVRDIADAASLGGSSIMSFIDWDQIDDLIADVR